MQSLTGKLNFCSYILPAGRAFLRRIYDSTMHLTNDNFIPIDPDMVEDLKIWKQFLLDFNSKIYKIDRPIWSPSFIHLYSDASKSGFGAVFIKDYIVGLFPPSWNKFSIQFLELYPIFLLASIFFEKFSNQEIVFHCDNRAIVDIINNSTSKDPSIMCLVRRLMLIFFKFNILFRAVHIRGVDNKLTDSLSRQCWSPALVSRYSLNPFPTPIPQHLQPFNFKIR